MVTRPLGIVLAVLCCAGAVAVAALARGAGDSAPARNGETDAPRPPKGLGEALVTVHGLTARSNVQSFCARNKREALCADAAVIPQDSPVLPVGPSARAGVLLDHRARSVTASIAVAKPMAAPD